MPNIVDHHGRRFGKLRVSLLNTCNFSCVYCVGQAAADSQLVTPVLKEEQLDTREFVALISAVHELIGLKSIRLTGGEPLLYPDLLSLIEKIKTLGIGDIRLTTNGYHLKNLASQLFVAGLRSINVSVDAIDTEISRKISRHHQPQRVFEGIEAALSMGFTVKLNAVILRGMNDQQIIPLLDYAASMGVKIRFLELMKMGHLYRSQTDMFFSEREILETISRHYTLEKLPHSPSETARYWSAGANRIFGIIANESTPFCHDCNRLRMDSRGYFYGCLSSSFGVKLAPFLNDQNELTQKLRHLLSLKQEVRFRGSSLSMKNIGG